jgi:DNA-directed RNA polymerase specialized sigma24 family protein
MSKSTRSEKGKSLDLSRTEISNAIDEWILNERDRKILKRRLLDGVCYEPLAEEFDLSVRHIKTIVYKCEDKLFRHI